MDVDRLLNRAGRGGAEQPTARHQQQRKKLIPYSQLILDCVLEGFLSRFQKEPSTYIIIIKCYFLLKKKKSCGERVKYFKVSLKNAAAAFRCCCHQKPKRIQNSALFYLFVTDDSPSLKAQESLVTARFLMDEEFASSCFYRSSRPFLLPIVNHRRRVSLSLMHLFIPKIEIVCHTLKKWRKRSYIEAIRT